MTTLAQLRALPEADLATIAGPGTVLILAPHQDDEVLGCGGLIAALVAAHRPPVVLFVTDGAGSHPNSRAYPPGRLTAIRRQEALEAAAILGLAKDRVSFMGLADTKAPQQGPEFAAAVAEISALATSCHATTLLAPWEHDPHGDHLAVHRMAEAAAASLGLRHLAYPVWGWTLPDTADLAGRPADGWRLDVSAHLDLRHRALMAHRSQTSALIDDDPGGFRLDAGTIARMQSDHETFLRLR